MQGLLDRELLRRFPLLRRYVLARSITAILGAALVVGQAVGIGTLLAALAGPHPADALAPARLVFLAVVFIGRVAVTGWDRGQSDVFASRWKLTLRADAATMLPARGIRHGSADPGALITLLTTGVDTVDSYLGTVATTLEAAVVPVAVLGTVFALDWLSGLVLLVALPLVPVLLALAGMYTKDRTERQWTTLLKLGSQFAEALSGLTTLRVLGRQQRTSARVREIAQAHRVAVVATLRVAFLSALAMETMASLSVALIAVPVGFRLLAGSMTLAAALPVLLLTPEAFRPLRMLGSQFHAAQDSRAMLTELDKAFPPPEPALDADQRRPAPSRPGLELCELAVGFDAPVLTGVSLRLEPGLRYAVIGRSGAGKSTLLRTIAGLLPPLAGTIRVDGLERTAVVPQRPHLFAGTVADNVRLGAQDADDEAVRQALEQAGALEFVRELPAGLATELGEGAGRLSAGQRQRLAVARALLRKPSLLLLDEPTARLDGGHEDAVLNALRGPTVVLVTHRPRVVERVDAVLRVSDGRVELVTS
ncbi:MAG TPA: thiol reductant ABC exporter subunit CydD [Pseudonocardiaceae bacterium]|jgi:thiol reductant ABC exporter CydD subunit|nr:thiol reductant ABC exporter subunit CydD [Pseudonocardiaceae bacterium]